MLAGRCTKDVGTIRRWTRKLVMKTKFAEAGYSKSKEEVEGCQRRERRGERRAEDEAPARLAPKRNFERGRRPCPMGRLIRPPSSTKHNSSTEHRSTGALCPCISGPLQGSID